MSARQTIKRAIKNLVLILVAPLYALYRLLSIPGNADGCFQSFSQFLSLIPGKTGVYIRAAFYRLACPDTSDEISIGFLTVLSHIDTSIQKGVYVGPQCNIGKCQLNDNVLIGSGVHILSGNKQHNILDIETPIQEQGGHFEKVIIGSDCWVGNGAIIMASLSAKTVVASGSIVTKESQAGDILAGNPARQIRNRHNLNDNTTAQNPHA